MKQVIQNYRMGVLGLIDASVPACSEDTLSIWNIRSLVSIGTERSMIELGKKNLLGKARAKPGLVKRFIGKAKNEGFVRIFKEV